MRRNVQVLRPCFIFLSNYHTYHQAPIILYKILAIDGGLLQNTLFVSPSSDKDKNLSCFVKFLMSGSLWIFVHVRHEASPSVLHGTYMHGIPNAGISYYQPRSSEMIRLVASVRLSICLFRFVEHTLCTISTVQSYVVHHWLALGTSYLHHGAQGGPIILRSRCLNCLIEMYPSARSERGWLAMCSKCTKIHGIRAWLRPAFVIKFMLC